VSFGLIAPAAPAHYCPTPPAAKPTCKH